MDVFLQDGQILDYSALPSVGNSCEDVKHLGTQRVDHVNVAQTEVANQQHEPVLAACLFAVRGMEILPRQRVANGLSWSTGHNCQSMVAMCCGSPSSAGGSGQGPQTSKI